MNSSPASSPTNGFKKWSSDHPPSSNDDDNPGTAAPMAIVESPSDRAAREPHRPWVIPGVGGAF